MTNEEFSNCPKARLLVGAQASYENALALYKVANNAATANEFGVGNSLLILSIEECIKSMILTAGYFNINLPFDIKPYFSDHKKKHLQANEIQPVITALNHVRRVFIDILRNRKSPQGTLINLGIAWLFFWLVNKSKKIELTADWWNQANTVKNNGLYVGYVDNKWKTPREIDQDTFNTTLAIAQPFIECLEIITELKSDDYKLLNGSTGPSSTETTLISYTD